jgi:hypothetical protein
MLDATGLALRSIPVLTACVKENTWTGPEGIIVRFARSILQLASFTTLIGTTLIGRSLTGSKVQVGIVSTRIVGSSDSVVLIL